MKELRKYLQKTVIRSGYDLEVNIETLEKKKQHVVLRPNDKTYTEWMLHHFLYKNISETTDKKY